MSKEEKVISKKVREYYTADICDEHRESCVVAEPIFKLFGQKKRCAGEIITIKLNEEAYHLRVLLKAPGYHRIAVVDAGGIYCAVFGDQLAENAIENNWAGLIINGYIRDAGLLEKMALPVWALGTCPKRSMKKSPAQTGITLKFAGVKFSQGNFVYADQDGILVTKIAIDSATSTG